MVKSNSTIKCQWRLRPAFDTKEGGRLCWSSLDLLFGRGDARSLLTTEGHSWNEIDVDDPSWQSDFGTVTPSLQFILDAIQNLRNDESSFWTASRLLLPYTPGHLIRNDIFSLRLTDCPTVGTLLSFIKDQRRLPAFAPCESGGTSPSDLTCAVKSAMAGILLERSDDSQKPEYAFESLDFELKRRLSFQFIAPGPYKRRTVAVLGGFDNRPDRGGTGADTAVAARALGIGLVILQRADHFLSEPKYRDCYDAFLAIDMTRDEALPQRAVDALRRWGGHVDGIVTYTNSISAHTAAAAAMMGLPTPPAASMERAHNKYETGVLDGRESACVRTRDELYQLTRTAEFGYPSIIKPCVGYSSQGVSLVRTFEELLAAYDLIQDVNNNVTNIRNQPCCVERYCDGPEVDVNLVVSQGRILFFEVSDDFPKQADGNGRCVAASSFIEYANILPSKLPMHELQLLEQSMHRVLLELDILDAIVHLEARIENSSMEYVMSKDGVMDLQPRHNPLGEGKSPQAFLIEINVRPPGKPESDAVESTHGIDYVGLSLLFTFLDYARIEALTRPFLGGPQYWCSMIFVQVSHGGVFASDDVVEELKVRRPDIAKHITKSLTFFRRGERVPDPSSGKTSWVAYIDVFSRISRRHVLEISEEVRKELRYHIA